MDFFPIPLAVCSFVCVLEVKFLGVNSSFTCRSRFLLDFWSNIKAKMQNEEGKITELYIPRKWCVINLFFLIFFFFFLLFLRTLLRILFVICYFSSATNRLITSKDHASVQINIGHLDENGIYTGQFSTFALCGFIRAQVRFLYV